MQWIAMLTMLIDHIGVVFFPEQIWLRIIGRIAFPIYAYLVVVGYQRTRSYRNYIIRVALLALIAQPAYQWAFDTTHLNIIVTLFVGLVLFKLLDYTAKHRIVQILLVLGTVAAADYFSFDYGAYGILLMLLFRYIRKEKLFLYHALLELVFLLVWGIQFFSLIVTYMISYQANILTKADAVKVPRWLWRSFYPLHLFTLALIKYMY